MLNWSDIYLSTSSNIGTLATALLTTSSDLLLDTHLKISNPPPSLNFGNFVVKNSLNSLHCSQYLE